MNKPITDNYTTIEKMFATDKTLHQHFEEQATKSPENIALIFGDTEISYFNLNQKSSQLAMLIRERFENLTGTPLPPETLIPICMEKGIEMIVAILAILKAGGAYVPIDPAIPQSRIDFIWKDLDAKLIISQSRIPATYTLQLPEQKTVFVDLETPLLKDFDEPFDWSVYSRPDGLAYVIYTSGTTGNPKGVMQTHHNVIRLFKATGTSFQFDAHDVWTFFHSYAFDFSVWEIWGALLHGAKLVVVDKQQTRDMDSFYQLCCAHSVTVLNQTPFAFYRFAEIAAERTDSASLSLRYIIFGGEALNVSLLKQWWTYQRDNALQTKLINMYGITETTVHVTYKEISENEPSISNIGKPISDLTAYILDSDGQPVAADIAGELHIGGAGLATGYLNNPELTAQRFIQNPFASDHDRQMGYTRMYKTGDLARWLPDGNLEYIGRNDDQVKIRGYRIELAEIEHALVQIPGITQAAVMARQRSGSTDSAKYLAAYYVLNPGHSVQRDAEILGSWEDLYDSEYNKNEGEILEADFSGWNSYVTGKPIPLPEMQAWRKDILDTLNSLKPKSILEIGVGSGLLMYPLLETVHQYTGLDISKAVIDRHRKYLENKKHEVRLFHLAADQVDHIPLKESFDTIIINSVCQYFPGIVYFEDVLLKAFEKLSENGTLFLGDVRNYDLHKQLIADKFRYAEKAGTDQDINRISLRENELLLSPAYFNGLQNRFTDMQVTVAERKGSYDNELSRYRYDVLISKKTDNKLLHQQTPGSNQAHTQALYNVPFLNQLSDEDILSALRKALPEYMVPATLVQMENFPLTSNGKLDKKAFPDPDMGSDEADYLSPQNETQAAICTIWQEVLGLKRVSIDDDFFRIGGDSILSIQAANRVRQMGFNCGVKDIFSCRTVEKLEKHLRHNRNQVALKSEQGLLSGTFGLLPIQQWFVYCIQKGQLPAYHHWNQSFLIRTDVLDIRQLEQALEALVVHHDMLRARFTISGTEWQQSYLSDMEIPELKALDVRGLTETQIEQSLSLWQNDFDLTSGPLFRMGYLSGYADGSARVYIALHHMIVDTVSWRILAEDLSTLYKGKKLPQKGSSYRQWVQYMEGYSSRFPNEEIYWNTLIPELTPHPEMEQKAFSASFELDPDTTQRLLQKAPAAYNTQVNDLLMTALAFALKDTDGKDIHTITLEGHGREALDPGIDHGRTLGWFTSLFPVRIKTEASILQTIPAIKEMLRAIPNRGIGYGAFTGHQRKLPPLRFNYLGQFDKPDGNWQITGEGNLLDVHPDNTDDLLIDISAMVTGGKLRFSITTKLGENYTNQINNHLQQRLKETVHHCIEKIQLEGPGFTPADYPDLQLSQPQLDSLQTAAVKAQNSITHIFPANSLQQGFIYHALTQPGDDAYMVQVLYDYQQQLDIPAYTAAWKTALDRYPILRTAFDWQEGTIQVVYKNGLLKYTLHDLSQLSPSERDERIEEILATDRAQAFDLASPTLLRLMIIKQSDNLYTVIKTEHHAIMDGWSGNVLLTFVHQQYQLIKEGKHVPSSEDSSYLLAQQYIQEQRQWADAYWEKALANLDEANDISPLLSRPADLDNYRQVELSAESRIAIPAELLRKVKNLCAKEGLTINVVVQFLWHKILQVYSGSDRTLVGTTVSGRELPVEGIEQSVGLYINTLPLAIAWDNESTVTEQMRQIQQQVTELNTHSFADLAKIQKHGQRLFHTLFVFENYPETEDKESVLKAKLRRYVEKLDYPIAVVPFEKGHELIIQLQYDQAYLDEPAAEDILNTFQHLLEQVIADPSRKHSSISLLKAEEYDLLLQDFGGALQPSPQNETLHAVFSAHAKRCPEQIALIFAENQLSYRELDQKSNCLARTIREKYVQLSGQALSPDTLIPICMDRGTEMITAILAVLKAGAAYVPVDPAYPQHRIDYILADTNAQIVLSQKHITQAYPILLPEEKIVLPEHHSPQSTDRLPEYSTPESLAYVIYTSGTTGKPKGVMVEHRQVLGLIRANDFIDLDRVKTVAGISNFAFDGSVFDFFFALMNGKQLLMIDHKTLLDLPLLDELISRHQADTVLAPTALFNALVFNRAKCLGVFKQVTFGGEACNILAVNQFKADHPDTALINLYGPTENIVYATYCLLQDYDTRNVVPIGKPSADKKIYILDRGGQPVPIGVTGELHIGGAGVTRGYLNNPELTAQRFPENPFASDSDRQMGYTRMYKTGDLAKWLPDGKILFTGRNDDQVKIRGYRIELAEIEHTLAQIPGIAQACVLVRERQTASGSSKYLTGYYVVNQDNPPDSTALSEQLKQILPHYMVPTALVRMDSFPLTNNAKLDKKAFPDPEPDNREDGYTAPQNEAQEHICSIWQEVLGITPVGITDDFFRIGGDSILSIQAANRIRRMGFNCLVKDIFSYRTVEKLEKHLRYNRNEVALRTEQGILSGSFGLLPIQQWFVQWVTEGLLPEYQHWNQSFFIKTDALDIEKLTQAIEKLVLQHDMLRTKYTMSGAEWQQTYSPQIEIPELKTLDIQQLSPAQIEETLFEWQNGFDLEKGPLFQIGYLYGYSDGTARVYIALHHLIVDMVSWRILAEDLRTAYEGKKLPQKGSSYRQWVEYMEGYPALYPDEKRYWDSQTADLPAASAILEKPLTLNIELDPAVTQGLLQKAPAAYNTQINDLLLTALALALKDLDGEDTHTITLEGHGREPLDLSIDHSRTVGWFTSMFPVRLKTSPSIQDNIRLVKETLSAIPNKGIGFGTFPANKSKLPAIRFNYLGQFDHTDADWKIVQEGTLPEIHPDNTDNLLIDINGMVTAGKLSFAITAKLGETNTRKLAEFLQGRLEETIHHCIEKIQLEGPGFTPADFPAVNISQELLDNLQTRAFKKNNGIAHLFSANSLQQGFIYHALSQPDDDAYLVQVLYDYQQALDTNAYIAAWKMCIDQHPILRTAFDWQDDAVQVIYKKGRLEYTLHDISDLRSFSEKDKLIAEIRIKDRTQPFDLSSPTLLRIHIIKQTEQLYIVIKTGHHSIMDGWSESLLFANLHGHYQQLMAGKRPLISEDESYLSAQQYILEHKQWANSYWEKALADLDGANNINALLSRAADLDNYRLVEHGAEKSLPIPGELLAKIRSLCMKEGVTINVVIQFLWHKILQVYSGTDRTVVGTTVSGRELPVEGIEESIGLYINTLPLVLDWKNSDPVIAQMRQIQKQITEINAHSFADLAKIQKHGQRLFHSLFVFENYPAADETETAVKTTMKESVEKLDYPITIASFEKDNELIIQLQYDQVYLDEPAAERLLNTFAYLLEQVIADPTRKHSSISLLEPETFDLTVHRWAGTKSSPAHTETLHARFAQQAAQQPDATAVIFGENRISYRQLDQQSSKLAHIIKKRYLQITGNELLPDTLIPICMDRGTEMITAILAVLKAGAAYVPIDPGYPQHRIAYILKDTGAQIMVSQQHIPEAYGIVLLPEQTILTEDIDAIGDELPSGPLPERTAPESLAYVIYTSGTTGNPKGVMVEHRNVLSFVLDNNFIDYNRVNTVAGISNFAFDGSVFDIFFTLINGKQLLLIDSKAILNPTLLDQLLSAHKADTIFSTTALFNALVFEQATCLEHLQQVLFGGEACNLEAINSFKLHYPHASLVHVYGPTENIVYSTYCSLTNYNTQSMAPIGAPLADKKIYVLDSAGQPVPVGVPGELHIGGAGVARGYLNHPELSEQRFLENPFAADSDKQMGYTRMYKTGDLVKWLPDGNILFIGRNDDQVKIRGYRIELAEIAHAIEQIPGVVQAIVMVRERATAIGSSRYLTGYYIPQAGNTADTSTIIQFLKKTLPDYMVPAALVQMESFPLTSNGKLDKKAFPDPDMGSAEADYLAPQNETQAAICTIWQEVLGLPRVSINDDFFRIGGDSILSIQTVNRIRQMGFNCGVKDIFSCRTVEKLEKHLRHNRNQVALKTEQGLLYGTFSLLPIQQWFALAVQQGLLPAYHHWNQSFLIRTDVLDTRQLEHALEALVGHHDMLRARFIVSGIEWQQSYLSDMEIPELKTLDVRGLTELQIQEILCLWQSDFDLFNGPLFRMGYLSGYADGSARVYIALHHMIVDTVSWRILAEDLSTLYKGRKLPQKGSSYRQWVQYMEGYSSRFPNEEIYWNTLIPELPSYPEMEQKAFSASFELDPDTTQGLLQKAPAAYNTQVNDLLMTALAFALKDADGKDIHGITLEGHGREALDPAIDHGRTLGWFTSMFPVRIKTEASIPETIPAIKEMLRAIPNRGIGYGAFTGHKGKLPPLRFNYLGQFDKTDGNWQITGEGNRLDVHPDNTEDLLIDISAMVTGGKLRFSIETKLGEDYTQQITNHLRQRLKETVHHCIEKIQLEGPGFTPSDFPDLQLSQPQLNGLQTAAVKAQNSIAHIFPANSLQQGFIYHALTQPGDDAYMVQVLYDYHQQLDITAYTTAWKTCIDQYPILRTAFDWQDGMIQVVYKNGLLKYTLHDISQLPPSERDEHIEQIRAADRAQGFDLSNPTLLRLHLIKQTDNLYTVIKTEHHAIIDGWSESVLSASLHHYYQLLLENKRVLFSEDSSYLLAQQYIQAQRQWADAYWEKALADLDGANDINPLLSRQTDLDNYRQVERSAESRIVIPAELLRKVRSLCTKEGLTINVVVQFLWHKILQVYSGSDRTVAGTTVSGRELPIEGIEQSVGLYINTLPLAIAWDNESTVTEQMRQIQQQVTELNAHSFADLAKIQKHGQRLFHSLFVFENYPEAEDKEGALKPNLRKSVEKLDYPIAVISFEKDHELIIQLQYDQACLDEPAAEDILNTFQHLLEQVVADPSRKHSSISLLKAEEYDLLLQDFGGALQPSPQNETLHAVLTKHALQYPEQPALLFAENQLSYRQLDQQSNRLARAIRTKYLQLSGQALSPDTLIPICMDRGTEMITSILAVLKAGAAYVPIDPAYPQHRIDYILADTNAQIVLSQKHITQAYPILLPEEKIVLPENYVHESTAPLPEYSAPESLAYVIYTSGTTGKPKGVMVEHRHVLGLIRANDFIDLDRVKTVAGISNFAFDGSVFDFFFALMNGKQLLMIDHKTLLDLPLLDELITRHQADTVLAPTALFNALVFNRAKCLGVFKQVTFGGEACNISAVNQFKADHPDTALINLYGPTENIVYGTYCSLQEYDTRNVVPIGKPSADKKIYILDRGGQPVPIGVAGELHIGGAGVARGYLNNPELTAQRFPENPFASDSDRQMGYTRMYKTGDLAKWLPDGKILFTGRNDDQVKIRGYRIELAEIEHALAQIPGIAQACVLVRERQTSSGSSKYLAGYYVASQDNLPDNASLSEQLRETLPDYMVPQMLVRMDSFPLTNNAKLDKKAFPDPEPDTREDDYTAPQNEVQDSICSIWQEVLGITHVGITDDFFRIGGNSILAIQASHRMSTALGYEVKVADIFKSKNIEALSKALPELMVDEENIEKEF